MTCHILLLLLASSVLGDPDSVGSEKGGWRRGQGRKKTARSVRPLQATASRVGGMMICKRASAVAEFWVSRLHRDPFLERILFEPGLLPCSLPRQPRHRRRLCSLGTCQTHRLPEMIYWLRCLHQGALREGRPRAPGPSQLRAPPPARGQGPAPSPGPWPEEKRPAQCPASWVTSGTSLPSPGLSLPICVLGPRPQVSFPLTPSPGLTQKLSPPAVIWAGPRGTPGPSMYKEY
ncbi:LOW QUALITY PROTEIN: putative adrenomedullin-5-like protein [Mirounga angustirostris]|uniref:LOW QUALITY PROTEIN: putative adrenomedullin-5-like protein n=1 Tax=Mirounga angustirostris TaxID=9716 RepID=UPI00313C3F9A